MLTIGDLTTVDAQAEFRSDVQLDAFDSPQLNSALLRSYLFTATIPESDSVSETPSVAAVGLLERVKQAFLNERLPNRLLAIANYGHGKSHLALAIANYFSRATRSPEIGILLDKIEKATKSSATTAGFREFKEARGEFLVVRLRGDVPRSLREQFLPALEKALAEHPATQGKKPHVWHVPADEFLRKHNSGEERKRADAYLEPHSLDLPTLLQKLQRREDVYDLCVGLVRHLTGVRPDFGGEVSLKTVIDEAVTAYCWPKGPLGGILVLFDEFSLYVQRYALRSAAGELQDLLNGIDAHRGKAVFLAFAPYDPMTAADTAALNSSERQSLKKELTRIQKKYALFSLMEGVIDAYLNQSKDAWGPFLSNPRTRGALFQASDVTQQIFNRRYSRDLRWGGEQFQRTVTEGCFPLHPLTTSYLCTLNLSAAEDLSAPRTVLGFVFEQYHGRQTEPALKGDQINWVLPIHLIDYFGMRLAGSAFKLYENALRTLGDDATDAQCSVLKALLLQELAGVNIRGDDQVHFVAQAVGATEPEALSTLKNLAEANCIRYDPSRKQSSLWPLSTDPQQLERVVREKRDKYPLDDDTLLGLADELEKLPEISFGAIPIGVPWGHREDWAARQVVFTPECLTPEQLTGLALPYQVNNQGVQEGNRGALVWLLARNEDETRWFREKAVEILRTAFPGDEAPPIVLMLPSTPRPELLDYFHRWRALQKFSADEQRSVGSAMYETEKGTTAKRIRDAVNGLRGLSANYQDAERSHSVYVVPATLRASVQALPSPSIREVLTECYRLIYRHSPPEFYDQYRVATQGANKLKDAVKFVASLLLQDALARSRDAIRTNALAQDLCEKFLRDKWGLITPEFRISEPTNPRIAAAWAMLDRTFVPGGPEVFVRDALLTLLNRPYGYDYNTATLVFSAWFGRCNQDLKVVAQGRVVKRETMREWLQAKSPKDFVSQLCVAQAAALARRAPDEEADEVRSLLGWTEGRTFAQQEADQALARLLDFVQHERSDQTLRDRAAGTAVTLSQAVQCAKEYQQQSRAIQEKLTQKKSVSDVLSLQREIGELPVLTMVHTDAPTPADLHNQWQTRLTELVQAECKANALLQSTTQLELHRSRLHALRQQLLKAGLADLAAEADAAEQELEQQATSLRSREQEDNLIATIQAISARGPLQTLHGLRAQLDEMGALPPRAEAARREKSNAISREVEALETYADGLEVELSRLDRGDDIQAWRDKQLRVCSRYEGTLYQTLFDRLDRRAKVIQSALTRLSSIQGRWSSPQEAQKALSDLEEMQTEFAAELSETQEAAIGSTKTKIERYMQDRRTAAEEQLARLEAQVSSGMGLDRLKAEMSSPPAFLSEDCLARWHQLQDHLQQRLDRDVIVRIESEFRQISDLKKRAECVAHLQRILAESEGRDPTSP